MASLDDIADELADVADDIAAGLPSSRREEMRARLDALENNEPESGVRFAGADPGERYFGAVIEYAWKSGPNSATHAQRVIDLKEQFDAGRPPLEGYPLCVIPREPQI